MDEKDVLICSKCQRKPILYQRSGLWYVECVGSCERLELAITKKKVIENWNELNRRVVKEKIKAKPKDEMKGVGLGGDTVYQFDANGNVIKTFMSLKHLANVVELPKNTIISKFYRSRSGCVTIKGIVYYREPKKNEKHNTKTTSTTTRRGRPKKIRD